jgi:hypothetical protein
MRFNQELKLIVYNYWRGYMNYITDAKNYVLTHRLEASVAIAVFGGLLAAMIATHGFNVSTSALHDGFLNFTAKGIVMNAGLSIVVAVAFTILFYKSKRVRYAMENLKAAGVALKAIGAIAVVLYLLPNPAFGGNMLIGGMIGGNLLAAGLIELGKWGYKKHYKKDPDAFDEREEAPISPPHKYSVGESW